MVDLVILAVDLEVVAEDHAQDLEVEVDADQDLALGVPDLGHAQDVIAVDPEAVLEVDIIEMIVLGLKVLAKRKKIVYLKAVLEAGVETKMANGVEIVKVPVEVSPEVEVEVLVLKRITT